MGRIFEIQSMDDVEIIKHCKTIKPIIRNEKGTFYLNGVSTEDIFQNSFYYNLESSLETVDFSKINVLANVRMIHRYINSSNFFPLISDIIKQIPKDLLNDTVAFEIIYAPNDNVDFANFTKEFALGYHVSIVRLYTNKSVSEEAYGMPLDMTEDEFLFCENRMKIEY